MRQDLQFTFSAFFDEKSFTWFAKLHVNVHSLAINFNVNLECGKRKKISQKNSFLSSLLIKFSSYNFLSAPQHPQLSESNVERWTQVCAIWLLNNNHINSSSQRCSIDFAVKFLKITENFVSDAQHFSALSFLFPSILKQRWMIRCRFLINITKNNWCCLKFFVSLFCYLSFEIFFSSFLFCKLL